MSMRKTSDEADKHSMNAPIQGAKSSYNNSSTNVLNQGTEFGPNKTSVVINALGANYTKVTQLEIVVLLP